MEPIIINLSQLIIFYQEMILQIDYIYIIFSLRAGICEFEIYCNVVALLYAQVLYLQYLLLLSSQIDVLILFHLFFNDRLVCGRASRFRLSSKASFFGLP